MKLPLVIDVRGFVPLPSMEPEIRRRADKLERRASDLVSCRVSVQTSASRRRQGHEYLATIDVRLPDAEVAVSRHHRGDDAMLALRGAFDAMERCLDDRAQIRSRDVKTHAPPRTVDTEEP
jgi:ribosome-associated translation inhibitor RaiA